MNTKQIGVGILGCGFIARAHIRGYMRFPNEARIVALCSRTMDACASTLDFIRNHAIEQSTKLEKAIEKGGPPEWLTDLKQRRAALLDTLKQQIHIYTAWEEMAGDSEVGLVSNNTPPFVHYPSTMGLMRAGKHVLLEKPFVGSLRHADGLIAEAKARGLCLSVVSQGRFADDQRRMRELVRQRKLGDVFLLKVDTHWYRSDDYYRLWWRGNWANECGGVLLNHAWHLLDQGLFIFGKPVVRVMAGMGAFVHTPLREKMVGGVPTDDTLVAILTFADGSLGEVTGGVTLHIQRAQIEVYGRRGAMLMNPWQLDSQDVEYGVELRRWAETCIEPTPPDWTPEAAERDSFDGVRQYRDPTWTHTTQVRDVLDAIAAGRPSASSGMEARATLEVVLAAYKSAITHQSVELPLSGDDPYYDGVLAALDPNTIHAREEQND
jgi:UDP-N-acetyl-2-amino-2-deoxyglucuronate dehydrogenase